METAYFVPDDQTEKFLVAAVKRGVKVEIVVPGKYIDEQEVRHASRARWGKLLRAGVKIYEYGPTMLHSKVLVVDDLWVTIGSANVDNRSFRLNDEANLNVLDGDFAREQSRIFEEDKAKSREVTYEHWRQRPLWDQVFGGVLSLFGGEL
jgi:cardiolipin synthase